MAILTFDLKHGLKTESTTHMEVGLRELSSGDVIDAQMAAEKVVVSNGAALAYTSDVLYGLEMLCRQIEYIGQIQGPFNIKQLRKLQPEDFNLIQEKARELDALILAEAENRGRTEGAG